MEPFHFNFAVFLLLLALPLFFEFFSVNYNALGQCLQAESSALLQLKRGFISGELHTWQPGTDCCIWKGVTCDESRRVTGLDLSDRSIADFGWDKLTNLSNLNLSYAGFVGKVPIGIFCSTKLTSVDLSLNSGLSLTTNPLFLRNTSNLRELYLDYVDLSAYGDEWCGALVNSTPILEVGWGDRWSELRRFQNGY